MSYKRTTIAGLIPVAFETISLSNSTALGLNSTIRASATVLDISIETQPVRFRADSTDPALTTGVVLQKDTFYQFFGFNGTSNLKFQRTTGSATISVMGWKQPGDGVRG